MEIRFPRFAVLRTVSVLPYLILLLLAILAPAIAVQSNAGPVLAGWDDTSLNTRGLNQFEGLQRRDVCSDVFPNRHKEICSPSNTLCCINPNASLPVCVTILGYGFCCTEDGTCFVDVKPACGDAGSDKCAPGLCCPAQTHCLQNFNYNNDSLVRCNVNKNLIPKSISSLVSTSSAGSTATSSASADASASPSIPVVSTSLGPTSTASAQTSTSDGGNGDGLSAGATAGIAIGSAAVVGVLGLAGWLLWRKRQSKKNEVAPVEQQSYNPQEQYETRQEMSNTNQIYEAGSGQPKERYGQGETPGQQQVHELP